MLDLQWFLCYYTLLLCFSFVEDVGSLDELKRELDEMKFVLKDSQSPVVFCHNDLCSGNIIYNHETGANESVRFLPLQVMLLHLGTNYIAHHFRVKGSLLIFCLPSSKQIT